MGMLRFWNRSECWVSLWWISQSERASTKEL